MVLEITLPHKFRVNLLKQVVCVRLPAKVQVEEVAPAILDQMPIQPGCCCH